MKTTQTNKEVSLFCPHCGSFYMSGEIGICNLKCEGDRKAYEARVANSVEITPDDIELVLPEQSKRGGLW